MQAIVSINPRFVGVCCQGFGSRMSIKIREYLITVMYRVSGGLQGTQAQQATSLPLHIRLLHPLMSALQEITETNLVDEPARASIRASRYSFTLFLISIASSFLAIFGLVVLGSIFPTGLWEQLRDMIIFVLLLPFFLAALLSVVAALVAAGLAIYSIFRRGERARTVVAALMAVVALLICYAIAASGALLLGSE